MPCFTELDSRSLWLCVILVSYKTTYAGLWKGSVVGMYLKITKSIPIFLVTMRQLPS